VAKVLFDACSTLRGTPLKLAQFLATEQEFLSEAYRERFSLASHRVEPINRALVGKILRVELGEPNARFRHFEDVPFAAASLGQVHAATALNGDALAVKLQYPGISDGVTSDLRLVKAMLGPTSLGPLFEACLGELRERLTEELDYRCEAANTAWFSEHLRLPDVIVPRVYPEYTTKHVIATELLAGLHATEYVATHPSQQARNHYGQLLTDLFHHSVFDLRFLHADPNFGNYLFTDDGKLGLIDFGCVRRLDPQFIEALRRLFTEQALDGETVEQLHTTLGVQYRADVSKSELHDFLLRWGQWLLEPHRSEVFDYAQNREYFERGFAMGNEARRFLGHYQGAFLYFGRAHHGLQRLLQTLGATVRVRIPNPR
jgi:predicted unusual protein kinase regulating ubiquinone biosynthesis (AarF/ABC1/UbiB family)